MEGEKGAGPLHIIVHLDPKFFVIRMEIARRKAVANFAGETSLGKPFAHVINQTAVR